MEDIERGNTECFTKPLLPDLDFHQVTSGKEVTRQIKQHMQSLWYYETVE